MSLCRWSSNDGMCDLYIYDSVGGFMSVNIAGRRTKRPWSQCRQVPLLQEDGSPVKYVNTGKTVMITAEDEYEDLPRPYAGKSYRFRYSPEERARLDALLDELKRLGFIWPDYLPQRLDESFSEYGPDPAPQDEGRTG